MMKHILVLWILRLSAMLLDAKKIALKQILAIKGVAEDFAGVFIRAPYIVDVG